MADGSVRAARPFTCLDLTEEVAAEAWARGHAMQQHEIAAYGLRAHAFR